MQSRAPVQACSQLDRFVQSMLPQHAPNDGLQLEPAHWMHCESPALTAQALWLGPASSPPCVPPMTTLARQLASPNSHVPSSGGLAGLSEHATTTSQARTTATGARMDRITP
jgi:hypothetical protein